MWCGRWPIRLASPARCAQMQDTAASLSACIALGVEPRGQARQASKHGQAASLVFLCPKARMVASPQDFMPHSLASVGAPSSAWTWTRQLVFKLYATCCYPQLVRTVPHLRRETPIVAWARSGERSGDGFRRILPSRHLCRLYEDLAARVLRQNMPPLLSLRLRPQAS